MKRLLTLAICIAFLPMLNGQLVSDIKSLKGFNYVKLNEESIENESTIYWKDGTETEGLFIYESPSDDIEWLYVDMYRFIYNKKGKAKRMKLKFKKMDSLLIGDDMYRFMKIKAKYGLIKINRSHSIYKVLADFERTQFIRFTPTSRPLTIPVEDNVPLTLIHNKESGEFFQLEDNGLVKFSKRLSKYLGDCSPAAEMVLDEKASDDKRSLLKKAMADDMDKNVNILLNALSVYDQCEN